MNATVRLGAAVALLVVAACGREPEPPPEVALTDTLAGFRLGMSREQADSSAAGGGGALQCRELAASRGIARTRCRGREDRLGVDLLNGQVIAIRETAAPADSAVPASTVAARIERGYGAPAFTRHGQDVTFPYQLFWVAPDSTSFLQLSCPDSIVGAGCELISRQTTPAQMQRAGG